MQPIIPLIKFLLGPKEIRVLMLGPKGAGKSTVLQRYRLGELVTTTPMPGFDVETVEYKNLSFTAWDLGGEERLRPLWRHYFQHTDGLIFVVDGGDQESIVGAKEELDRLLREDELQDASLLVHVNKQDLPNTMSVAEVTDKLGLQGVRSHSWYIHGATAVSGEGLYEGFDWLTNELRKKKN